MLILASPARLWYRVDDPSGTMPHAYQIVIISKVVSDEALMIVGRLNWRVVVANITIIL